jgi:hypothetical protein
VNVLNFDWIYLLFSWYGILLRLEPSYRHKKSEITIAIAHQVESQSHLGVQSISWLTSSDLLSRQKLDWIIERFPLDVNDTDME